MPGHGPRGGGGGDAQRHAIHGVAASGCRPVCCQAAPVAYAVYVRAIALGLVFLALRWPWVDARTGRTGQRARAPRGVGRVRRCPVVQAHSLRRESTARHPPDERGNVSWTGGGQ